MKSLSLQTTLGIAKLGTKSLRITVPEGVVAYLDLRSGDKLEWRMEIENGEKVVLVRKAGFGGRQTFKSASKREKARE